MILKLPFDIALGRAHRGGAALVYADRGTIDPAALDRQWQRVALPLHRP